MSPTTTIFFLVLVLLVVVCATFTDAASPPLHHQRHNKKQHSNKNINNNPRQLISPVQNCLPPHALHPWCDVNLPLAFRVNSLIANLTLQEKFGLLGSDPAFNTCTFMDYGVPRLGIAPFLNLVETNTGVASGCYDSQEQCATTFPAPQFLAATFNRTVWRQKGGVIGTEMRAMSNLNRTRFRPHSGYYLSMNGFGPDINIIRDPRYGRNDECASEDPFLSGIYAQIYSEGMRHGFEGDKSKNNNSYYLMLSYLKHYAAYSVEANRGSFIPNVTVFDLHDTYLKQFELGMKSSDGVMCSYAGVNGVPSCADKYLLTTMLRERWNHSDVVVTTDCGSIQNMVTGNHYAKNLPDAAAAAMNAGCDLNTNDIYSITGLPIAVAEGLVKESTLDVSLKRVLTLRFKLGLFDPVDRQPFALYGRDKVGSIPHGAILREAGEQGFVLLRNDKSKTSSETALPLRRGMKIAVLGPHIKTQRQLLSEYFGDQVCANSAGDTVFDCIPTMLSAMQQEAGNNDIVGFAEGVSIDGFNASGIPAAVELAQSADVAVLFLGLNHSVEGETIDRQYTDLPGLQTYFARQIINSMGNGKRVVIVFVNGGMISFDDLLLPPENNNHVLLAFVEAFYPAFSAPQLSQHLYGKLNRWGKLPTTIYSTSYQHQHSMTDFNVHTPPGRTYRYFTGTPLFDFGHGLSYTTFSTSCSSNSNNTVVVSCRVTNIGSVGGDHVLLVYHRVGDRIRQQYEALHPFPIKNLVDFDRVRLGALEEMTVHFTLQRDYWKTTDAGGNQVLYPGTHELLIENNVLKFTVS